MTTIEPGDTILGKYRVERVLGRGGMGFVVAARHVQLGELYAIKIMLPARFEDDNAGRRFIREARASARLKGEHVAQVHDVGQTEDGTLYMVMEHLEGTDFKELLATQSRLSPEDAVKYILQACNALLEAHELGLIHRDIKPANLFLTRKRRSGEPLVKVLDFGISKDMSLEKSSDLTNSGAVLGSPLYMSPEQLLNSRDVDARTDIWSLGVVLYELVAGVPPFAGETFTQLALNILNRSPQPIRTHVPEVSSAFESVIHRCLSKEPEQRYQSIEALAKALETVLKDGVRAVPDGPEFAPTFKEPLIAPQQNADVNPLGSTLDVGSDPARVPAAEIVEKNTDQAISNKAVGLDKDALPVATTLQSVTPPPLDTTTRPANRSRMTIALGGTVVLGVVALLGVQALRTNSPTNVPATLSPSAEIPVHSPTVPQSNPGSTNQIVAPPEVSVDISNVRPADSQAAPVVASASSSTSAPPPRVNNKKLSPTEGDSSTVQTPPTPAGTITASAAPKPSGTPGWRQGPL